MADFKEKSQAQLLKEQLFFKAKNTYNELSEEDLGKGNKKDQ